MKLLILVRFRFFYCLECSWELGIMIENKFLSIFVAGDKVFSWMSDVYLIRVDFKWIEYRLIDFCDIFLIFL